MDNLKFIIFSIIIVAVLGLAGFWAVTTIESGGDHVYNQEFKDLEDKNKELEKQLASLTRENDLLKSEKDNPENNVPKETEQPKVEEKAPVTTPNKTTTTTAQTTTKTTTYKYQTLIDELQKLVNINIYLKLKSQGAAVGSVQKFLNIYKPGSVKVDNDYGVTTVTLVKAYQKAQKLTADGEVGAGTLKNMISWLKTKK